MEDYLGYPKHEKADKPNKHNNRHTKKTVRSDTGDLEIFTLRDRDALKWSSYIEEAHNLFANVSIYFASHYWPM